MQQLADRSDGDPHGVDEAGRTRLPLVTLPAPASMTMAMAMASLVR